MFKGLKTLSRLGGGSFAYYLGNYETSLSISLYLDAPITVAHRFGRVSIHAARHSAVLLLKSNVVHVTIPKSTLNNQDELKTWLTEVKQLLTDKLKNGPVAL
ncbi:MAG: hypothetical protein Q7K57_11495 [Burkholderiaceae bacterium]|nr:hypothetical protein [Burkholderiaceae bacterium]